MIEQKKKCKCGHPEWRHTIKSRTGLRCSGFIRLKGWHKYNCNCQNFREETLPFKANMHLAKNWKLGKVVGMIANYPAKYETPKYLLFIKKMLENGWQVKVYVARVSKYIFIIKDNEVFKIRFSNHKPLYDKEVESDCDFYVGISHKQVITTEELIKRFIKENETIGV